MYEDRNYAMLPIDQVIQESQKQTREYHQKDWKKNVLPTRARFIMKMKFFNAANENGGKGAAFYSFDFEQLSGKWVENEELGLTKLLRYMHNTRGKWYTVLIYACQDDEKSTGKAKARSNYDLLILHFTDARSEAKRKRFRNRDVSFNAQGLMDR